MAWYRCGGGGLPAGLQSDMNTVLNKKLGTSTTYPPTDWPDTVNLLGPLPEKTVSGSIANITDGADGVPIKNWLVTLPASLDGYSSIGCTVSGKNLMQNLKYQATANRVNIGQSDDGFSVSLRAGTYTLSATTSINTRAYYRGENDGSNTLVWSAYGTSGNGTFTLSEDKNVRFWLIGQGGSISTSDVLTIQLEVGSTATSYEAYTAPTTATASLGRTIYGGTADIVTGEGEDENGNDFTFTPLSPTPETPLGVSNWWADNGDSTVTYRADISLALQALGGGGRGLMMMRPTEPEETEETEETEGLEDELNR